MCLVKFHASRAACSLQPMQSTITSACFATLRACAICRRSCSGSLREDFVALPRTAVRCDFAAFAVNHLHPVADFRANAIEHGDNCVWARRCSRPARLRLAFGPMTAMVFNRSGFSGARLFSFFRSVMDSRAASKAKARFCSQPTIRSGLVGINIRIIKQAHLEFPIQHRRNQFIQLRFLENFFADEFDEVLIAIRLRKFDVHAGFDRQRARCAACPSRRNGHACAGRWFNSWMA